MNDVDPRFEAARYLAEAVTGVKAFELLGVDSVGDPAVIEATYEHAVAMHTTCGCERHVRLTRARDILLDVPPAIPGELRLM